MLDINNNDKFFCACYSRKKICTIVLCGTCMKNNTLPSLAFIASTLITTSLATQAQEKPQENVEDNIPEIIQEDIPESVEVLHWWTSGGEASALFILQKDLSLKGIQWHDMGVAGGAGNQATTALANRINNNNPPTSAQMLGYDILEWAKVDGTLANINETAEAENWDTLVPKAVQRFSKYQDQWIAAPVNVHTSNWMWINKEIFDQADTKLPQTWDELILLLDAIKANGKLALAHGGQPWQDVVLFESIALSLGQDFYQSALIDLDEQALTSPKMVTVFERMRKLSEYVDDNVNGRDWNLASAMVMRGLAGVQIQGDWVKGEFVNLGKEPDEDFICVRFPNTDGSLIYHSEQFVMFNVAQEQRRAQNEMARNVMSPEFQLAFNVDKGSVPARMDVPDTAFDSCGQKAIADLKKSDTDNTMFGSVSHGHSAPPEVKAAIFKVVSEHFSGQYTNKEAAALLATSIKEVL